MFKTGDRVRIKQWDDMVKEFGTARSSLTGGECIRTEVAFTEHMKHLCGRTATIRLISYGTVCSLEFDDKSGDLLWGYSLDMLEPIEGKDILLETDKILVYKENGKTHIEVMD